MSSVAFTHAMPEKAALSFHHALEAELDWCQACIEHRITYGASRHTGAGNVGLPLPPKLSSCHYATLVNSLELNTGQRLAVIMALVPLIRPPLFDVFLQINESTQRPYTEFGCVDQNGVIWATGHTLAFVLGDADGEEAPWSILAMLAVSDPANKAFESLFDTPDPDLPAGLWRALRLKPSVSYECLTNQPYKPEKEPSFAAQRMDTSLAWDQVVHSSAVQDQLEDMLLWLEHGETLRQKWGMAGHIRPGFRALFYGPPGTGKTLTASLIGHQAKRSVYRVDIALVMSKYIGETEKNLEAVFTLAEDNHWILFFDEADALFGQRVKTSGANDQFANQNVAYLLQRIEQYSGIIILATNLSDNMDEAFFRRFESVVHFSLPQADERLQLWRQAIPSLAKLAPDVHLEHLAHEYVLSGADIYNVVRHAALKALGRGDQTLSLAELVNAIERYERSHNRQRHR